MRHKGCTGYLIEDRNEDLLRAYNKIVRRGGFLSYPEIYAELSRVPASRFWITGEQAYGHLIRRIGGEEGVGFSERAAMYDEIERRAHKYKAEHGTTFRKACKAVVLQKAPRFYLTPRTMENIIRNILRKRKRQRKP